MRVIQNVKLLPTAMALKYLVEYPGNTLGNTLKKQRRLKSVAIEAYNRNRYRIVKPINEWYDLK